jgi:ketosteroid isomerase-like protein
MTTSPSATDQSAQTQATIDRFNAAINRGDLDAAMAETTDDVLFENTSPFPDGERFVGKAAMRVFFQDMLDGNQTSRFDAEDMFVAGERCTVCWVYHWVDRSGNPGHIRGVDVFKLRDGLICEKLAYVKG